MDELIRGKLNKDNIKKPNKFTIHVYGKKTHTVHVKK